jgi:hypothetical protein
MRIRLEGRLRSQRLNELKHLYHPTTSDAMRALAARRPVTRDAAGMKK